MSKGSEAGYKRPPANRRFKKGQSGNPRGRPKGSRNLASLIDEILDEPIRVKMEGQQLAVTGRHALGIQMVKRAVAGDLRIVQLMQRYKLFDAADPPKIIWIDDALDGL